MLTLTDLRRLAFGERDAKNRTRASPPGALAGLDHLCLLSISTFLGRLSGTLVSPAGYLPLLRRQVENHGTPQQRVAFDGGYTSRANLAHAKELSVEHMGVPQRSAIFSRPTMTPPALPS